MILEELASEAGKLDLQFLLIGGHAVNFHGYSRFTKDVDLLINRDFLPRWSNLLQAHGYQLSRTGPTFGQFEHQDSNVPGVDLMLVNEQTFQKLFARAKIETKGTISIPLVCAEHLIALKLHALKQDLEHRRLKDFLDVAKSLERAKSICKMMRCEGFSPNMERRISTGESSSQLNETPAWDIGELPLLPPEFGEPPRLSFAEHLRFCDEMLRFNRRYGINVQVGATPVSEEFVM